MSLPLFTHQRTCCSSGDAGRSLLFSSNKLHSFPFCAGSWGAMKTEDFRKTWCKTVPSENIQSPQRTQERLQDNFWTFWRTTHETSLKMWRRLHQTFLQLGPVRRSKMRMAGNPPKPTKTWGWSCSQKSFSQRFDQNVTFQGFSFQFTKFHSFLSSPCQFGTRRDDNSRIRLQHKKQRVKVWRCSEVPAPLLPSRPQNFLRFIFIILII